MRKLSVPWEDALVISILGLKVGYLALKDRLSRLWDVKGRFELLDVGFGFFLAKFDRMEDRSAVVNGGPWMAFDHYVAVSPWSREFSPTTCRVRKTLVWIRLPALGLVFYDEEVLKIIASAIGKPIKVDRNTLMANRGKYARICIEIDLSLPVVSSILINGEWQRVEYEGLHLICTKCGRYGHFKRNCSELVEEVRTDDVEKVIDEEDPHPVSEEQDCAQSGVEEINMCSDECKPVPPQPPIGDWVVVQPRRKKKGATPELGHQKAGPPLMKQQQKTDKQLAKVSLHPKMAPRKEVWGHWAAYKGYNREDLGQFQLSNTMSSKADEDGDRQGLKRSRPMISFADGFTSHAREDDSVKCELLPPPAPPDAEMQIVSV